MRRRLALFGLVLLLTIPLVILLQDFARDVLLIEIMRWVWAVRILFESLPQTPFWIAVLAAIVFIAVGSLTKKQKDERESLQAEADHQGRVRVLARWIQRAEEGEYFRWTLAHYLGKLTWDVMAHRERTTPQELKQRLKATQLDLPPVVEAYLQPAQTARFSPPSGLLARMWKRLPFKPSDSLPAPALTEIAQFLERQLEVRHDPRDH
ncbi:MAG: hypothetical protein PVH17_03435 [Anaerolineae bacterium]|jgi:hypothetical protein